MSFFKAFGLAIFVAAGLLGETAGSAHAQQLVTFIEDSDVAVQNTRGRLEFPYVQSQQQQGIIVATVNTHMTVAIKARSYIFLPKCRSLSGPAHA